MNDWATLRREVDTLAVNFPNQTYLLYAMGLRLGTMDYPTLETDDLLDGPDDKKVDFCRIDLESGVATLAVGPKP